MVQVTAKKIEGLKVTGIGYEYEDDNGVKHTQGAFKNRVKHGKWSSWTPQGKLYYSAIFENGHKVKEVYAADPNRPAF